MRYARARFDAADREMMYRMYVARHLQLLAGTNLSYTELLSGTATSDFDAQQVVDDVASRICEEA